MMSKVTVFLRTFFLLLIITACSSESSLSLPSTPTALPPNPFTESESTQAPARAPIGAYSVVPLNFDPFEDGLVY
ncbi:MAG: hypothetical protein WA110_05255, partial [Anaerolineaceae bacterium]